MLKPVQNEGVAAASAPTSERVEAPKLEVVARKTAETTAPPPSAAEAPGRKKSGRRKLFLGALLLAAIGGGSWYGHEWWTNGRFMVSTDDAYIAVDMAVMTPKITGYVASVPVTDNQAVKAGDPIVEIDQGDFQLALQAADAKIATQKATVERIRAQRAAAVEQVAEAEATRSAAAASLDQANLTLQRAESLVKSGTGAQAPLDAARSAQAEAKAQLTGTEAAISAAQANVGVLDAQVAEAETSVNALEIDRDVAARNLTFTTIRAPYDGVVGNLGVQPGDLVSPSRRLAAIVPLDKVYIDANFKETQLGSIAVGEKARIEVDALPGVDVEGTVASFSPASGSVFSLLPADNATGNFTKIVQRVPVRIAIDPAEAHAGHLRPGLSVTVSVDTRTAPNGGNVTARQ